MKLFYQNWLIVYNCCWSYASLGTFGDFGDASIAFEQRNGVIGFEMDTTHLIEMRCFFLAFTENACVTGVFIWFSWFHSASCTLAFTGIGNVLVMTFRDDFLDQFVLETHFDTSTISRVWVYMLKSRFTLEHAQIHGNVWFVCDEYMPIETAAVNTSVFVVTNYYFIPPSQYVYIVHENWSLTKCMWRTPKFRWNELQPQRE